MGDRDLKTEVPRAKTDLSASDLAMPKVPRAAKLQEASIFSVKCEKMSLQDIYVCTITRDADGAVIKKITYPNPYFAIIDGYLKRGLMPSYSSDNPGEITFVKPSEPYFAPVPPASSIKKKKFETDPAPSSGEKKTSGFASDDNFFVYAPTQELADAILAEAKESRDRIARKWTDRPLRPFEFPCMVHAVIQNNKDPGMAFTELRDPSDSNRKHYNIIMERPIPSLTGPTIRHEVAHTVLFELFPGLPRWALEGTAMFEDGYNREYEIRNILIKWVKNGGFPNLKAILLWNDRMKGTNFDDNYYAASNSFTKFLLSLDPDEVTYRHRYFGFAQATQKARTQADLDAAVREFYGLAAKNLAALEDRWRAWVKQEYGA